MRHPASHVHEARVLRQAATPAESALWAALRGRAHLNLRVRRQALVAGCLLPFWCPDLGLALTLDDSTPRLPPGARLLRLSPGQVLPDAGPALALIAQAAAGSGRFSRIGRCTSAENAPTATPSHQTTV